MQWLIWSQYISKPERPENDQEKKYKFHQKKETIKRGGNTDQKLNEADQKSRE